MGPAGAAVIGARRCSTIAAAPSRTVRAQHRELHRHGEVPVGLAGPLRVNGADAHGDYYVPLATTEAALVASYSRGAQLITDAGGCTAVLLNEGVSRAPGFAFDPWRRRHVRRVGDDVDRRLPRVRRRTTRYGQLIDMQFTVEGNHVYLRFEFTTGDASGQNMVTIATDAICRHIVDAARRSGRATGSSKRTCPATRRPRPSRS